MRLQSLPREDVAADANNPAAGGVPKRSGTRRFRQVLLGDRRDTPAPATNGSFVPGGDDARRAAAAHNSSVGESQTRWMESYPRRTRVGSIGSAADSGTDLTRPDLSLLHDDMDVDLPPTPRHDFVDLMPDEILLHIFGFLGGSDLSSVQLVSRKWRAITEDSCIWRSLFLRNYGRRVPSIPPPVQVGGCGAGRSNQPMQQWKKMFLARKQLDYNWRQGARGAGKAIYLSGHTDSVYCVQFDENKIITGSRDRTIRVWDTNTYECIRVIGGPAAKPVSLPKVLRTVDYPHFHKATASVNGTPRGDAIFHVPKYWHDASVLCLQYDEEILITGSSDSSLIVWDIKTYEPITRLSRHTGGVLDVALDTKHIVSCAKDSRIIVWDRATFKYKGELLAHRGPVNAIQLRGKMLVSASGDGVARLWDISTMKLVKEFTAKERGLAAVEFSEDMQYVLAGGNDHITYKFEVDSGFEEQQFTGHTQLVRSLWLDSANNRVVSGSYDLDVRVYDFATGEEIWRAAEWTTSWMLAAKSDYRRIVATSQDGRVLLIDFGLNKGGPDDGKPIPNLELLRDRDYPHEAKWHRDGV
ncbi:WD40 repeat-like protein [Piedraia hortae CBS 480.64]|uniref:WD40 repeat-like protein n=1 Tax=Piedraia hortae CBS 480.64 TaxID=1314780 RepID=A0A6A7BTT4_9PEZI|nr:WD40 repeat-like protein [Piedraia hortae CBS 480.64]